MNGTLTETLEYIKKLNLALDEKEEEISGLYERARLTEGLIGDGIWDWHPGTSPTGDPADDYEYYSPRWKSILGYEDHELPNVARTWMELIHPEDRDAAVASALAHMADPENVPYYNVVRYWHKEGHFVKIICKGQAVRDAKGNVTRFLGIHQDVSGFYASAFTACPFPGCLRKKQHSE